MADALDESEEMPAEYAEAVPELIRQVTGHVVTGLKSRWTDLQLRVEAGPVPTWASGETSWLLCGEPLKVVIEMRLSAALTAALKAAKQQTVETALRRSRIQIKDLTCSSTSNSP
jgi:hypothetical protein